MIKSESVKFEKKTDMEWLTSTCIKQVISKTSNTAILYYLAFNAFYVGVFLVKIIFISFKIIIVNNFL